MNSKLKILLLAAGCWLLVALSACNEATQHDASGSPDLIRRAQLAGHENIQLKKQIETLKAEIADLNRQNESDLATIDTMKDEHGTLYTRLLEMLTECHNALESQ